MLVSLAGLECTNLISTYPEDDPEEINKNMKSKMMLGVGALNVLVGVLLAIGQGLTRKSEPRDLYLSEKFQRVKPSKGVSYFAATVLEEFNSYEVQQMAGAGRKYGSVPSQTSTIGRYIYGQCLFIGWAAMVVHILAGNIFKLPMPNPLALPIYPILERGSNSTLTLKSGRNLFVNLTKI